MSATLTNSSPNVSVSIPSSGVNISRRWRACRVSDKPNEEGPIDLEIGRVVGRRWKITEKLGEGGCGSVYKVQDINTMAKAALKAESNFVPGGSVLKLEVQVRQLALCQINDMKQTGDSLRLHDEFMILRRLEGRRYIAQLLQAGKKTTYSYVVMTLFGHSLNSLMRRLGQCSVSTQVRVGINVLYGLKQLHEVGFVHRDVKPANLAVGRRGKEARIIHILDFGLSREYIISANGTVQLRVPRPRVLFRGTVRYCSPSAHNHNEQGRADDLWSMVYVLVEMRGPLPWYKHRKKHKVGQIKMSVSDEELFQYSPKELIDIAVHLRSLDYSKRPDYLLIYNIFASIMSKSNYRYDEPFDWEEGMRPGGASPYCKSAEQRFDSAQRKSADTSLKTDATPESSKSPTNDEQFFIPADFSRNEIGF